MEEPRPYLREHYRLPVTYPVMFSTAMAIGEGTITNLSVFGCTIKTTVHLPENRSVTLRLLLPDQHKSLPIEIAEVRWVMANQAGIKFVQVERAVNLQLHNFVWDRMVERIRTIQQQVSS
jgi:PilZ domain